MYRAHEGPTDVLSGVSDNFAEPFKRHGGKHDFGSSRGLYRFSCKYTFITSVSRILELTKAQKGSHILIPLLSVSSHQTVHAIARKSLSTTSSNLKPVILSDPSAWPKSVHSLSPRPDIFFSALGTTKAAAGSLEAQRAVDYDLNLALARAAKEAGVKVYVLISSAAVSKNSIFPYSKMKGELEEAIKEIGFLHTVIVKPGLLVGKRTESRPAEAILRSLAHAMGLVSKPWLMDWWAQDVDTIGNATVTAGLQCLEGKREKGVWEVGMSDIIKLGRTGWKGVKGD